MVLRRGTCIYTMANFMVTVDSTIHTFPFDIDQLALGENVWTRHWQLESGISSDLEQNYNFSITVKRCLELTYPYRQSARHGPAFRV